MTASNKQPSPLGPKSRAPGCRRFSRESRVRDPCGDKQGQEASVARIPGPFGINSLGLSDVGFAEGRRLTLLRQSTIGAAAASSIPASAIWRQASATFWLSS